MFKRLFSKPLELKVGDQVLNFVNDFDFCLAGRIAVPSKKITDMVKFSTDQLKKEARTIKDIEKRFVNILSRSIEDNTSINRAMRELDPLIFSQDHSWREIIAALNNGGDELNEFRRIALAKYMQYLASRQEVIKHICASKQDTTKRGYGVVSRQAADLRTDDLTKVVDSDESVDDRPTEIVRTGDAAIREAVLLHSQGNNGSNASKKSAFARLPKGEVVVIDIDRGQVIELMLSRHRFRIVATDDLTLIDETGASHELQNGRNIIGRDTICNIVVSPTLRDISRLHLIIERLSPDSLRLTDLSAHGTYLPASFLSRQAS